MTGQELFAPLPATAYDIIYADPPWSFEGGNKTKPKGIGANKIVGRHYDIVSTNDLATLPVWQIARKDCLLFMWAVSPMLEDALKLGRNWSFKYATVAFVWDKKIANCGNYTLPVVEMVLVFKRGKIPTPRGARNVRQFLSEKRQAHSVKPDEIRNRITKMFPAQKKIELFARRPVDGWDVWGNEV